MNDLYSHEKKVLGILVAFFLLYKLIVFRMADIGGDAINYWMAAKHLFYGLRYVELSHQTTRFGIIFPVFLSQLIFGIHPVVTAIVPNILFIMQVFLIYKIGVRIHSVKAGFISAVLFMLCPYVIRWGSQILPPAFEGPALALSFYFLLDYGEKEKHSLIYIVISAFLLFWAYTVKVTAIYFMPAFIIIIFMMRRNWRHVLLFCGLLFILFLIEGSFYYYFTGDFIRRFHAITGNHLTQEKLVPVSFLTLFTRYTKSIVMWRVPFFIYLAMLVPVYRKGDVKVKGLVLSGIFYFILIIFSVKSIDPIIPAFRPKKQYLMAGFTFMIPVIAIGAIIIYEKIKKIYRSFFEGDDQGVSVKPYIFSVAVISAILVFITGTGLLPKKPPVYYNSIFNLKEHELVRFFTYHRMINDAFNDNIPVVSDYFYTVDNLKSYNRVQKVIRGGKNLREACREVGIKKSRYFEIRPVMMKKSLNGAKKFFLDLPPDRLPKIKTVTIGNRIYSYFINEKNSAGEPAVKPELGSYVLFTGSRDLELKYGKISN